jgi:hypothetical protein
MFKVALPIGALSFAMVWWALLRGYLKDTSGVDALRKEIKALTKEKSRNKKEKKPQAKTDPVHDKWLRFGGGFYGLVALYTYGLVEFREVRDFIAGFGGISEFLSQLNFDMFINLFIDALTNFITAIAWPMYWMSDISSDRIWLWFIIAYGGYWAGMKLALHRRMGSE